MKSCLEKNHADELDDGKRPTKNKNGLASIDANPLILYGGPCWNRTNNLLIKSQLLCLVELTARQGSFGINFARGCQTVFGVWSAVGIEGRGPQIQATISVLFPAVFRFDIENQGN